MSAAQTSDPAVEALRRLIGDSVERRSQIADQLGCNEQTLYQITHGVRLKSGNPRSVGRKLRAALDSTFPGWLTTSSAAQPSVPLRAALPVVLDAIAACPARAELRQLLPLLIDSNAPAYRQRLTELLLQAAARQTDELPPVHNPAAPDKQNELDRLSRQAEEQDGHERKRRRAAGA